MSDERHPEMKVRDKRVEIPLKDLSIPTQSLISLLHRRRNMRAILEFGGGVQAPLLFAEKLILSASFFAGYFGIKRLLTAADIQKIHEAIVETFQKYGVINPEHEGNYPRDWMNPSIVGKTHPVFFVKGNGNLVLLKESKAEYWRYKVQQARLVKLLGANPWMWRGFLRPPTAPEAFKKKVAKRLRALMEKIPRIVTRRKPARELSRIRRMGFKPRRR